MAAAPGGVLALAARCARCALHSLKLPEAMPSRADPACRVHHQPPLTAGTVGQSLDRLCCGRSTTVPPAWSSIAADEGRLLHRAFAAQPALGNGGGNSSANVDAGHAGCSGAFSATPRQQGACSASTPTRAFSRAGERGWPALSCSTAHAAAAAMPSTSVAGWVRQQRGASPPPPAALLCGWSALPATASGSASPLPGGPSGLRARVTPSPLLHAAGSGPGGVVLVMQRAQYHGWYYGSKVRSRGIQSVQSVEELGQMLREEGRR